MEVLCHFCGKSWDYLGKNVSQATCPGCGRKTPVQKPEWFGTVTTSEGTFSGRLLKGDEVTLLVQGTPKKFNFDQIIELKTKRLSCLKKKSEKIL